MKKKTMKVKEKEVSKKDSMKKHEEKEKKMIGKMAKMHKGKSSY